MGAARVLRETRDGSGGSGWGQDVYGIVTTGELWKFLKYHGDTINIDTETYSLHDLNALFNILRFITRAEF